MAIDPETGRFYYDPEWQGPLSGRSFERQTEDAINAALAVGIANAFDGTPSPAGVGASGDSTEWARGNHVHPAQTTISGNAATATKLRNARSITLSGDATGTSAFDGSANANIAVTIPEATTAAHGLMSVLDKQYLDSLETSTEELEAEIEETTDNLTLLKTALGLANPSQKVEIQNYLGLRGGDHQIQSVCYASKNNYFVVGATYTADDLHDGILFAVPDLTSPPSTPTSATVAAGHINDLAYDPDGNGGAGLIYIAPGGGDGSVDRPLTGHEGKIYVADPSTLSLNSGDTWSLGNTPIWNVSVSGGYLYITQGGYIKRYIISTKQLDATFTPIAYAVPTYAGGETAPASQASFIYGDIFVLIYVIKGSLSLSYKRAVYVCYDLKTGAHVTTSYRLPNAEEVECGAIMGGALYQISIRGTQKAGIYISPLDTVYMTDRYSGGRIPDDTDLDTLLAEGSYYIASGTSLATFGNVPTLGGNTASSGVIKVFDSGITGQKIQVLMLGTGYVRWRRINTESGSTTPWLTLPAQTKFGSTPIHTHTFSSGDAHTSTNPYTVTITAPADAVLVKIVAPQAGAALTGYLNIYYGDSVRLRTSMSNVVGTSSTRTLYALTERDRGLVKLQTWSGPSDNQPSTGDNLNINPAPLFVADSDTVTKVEFWLASPGTVPDGTTIDIYGAQ